MTVRQRETPPGAGLGQILETFREEETKVECPACRFGRIQCHVCKGVGETVCSYCKGGGFKEIEQIGPSQYATVRCDHCKGERSWPCPYCKGKKSWGCAYCKETGMVPANKASTWRRMQAAT